MKNLSLKICQIFIFSLIILYSNSGFSQNDSIPENNEVTEKKVKKKKDEFKVLLGATINNMSVSSDEYNSSSGIGYIIGAKYKRGRFFYWELGARYNATNYSLIDGITEDDLKINSIDIPINVGINLLSITSRLVGLRLYLGAVPTFTTNVSDNLLNITKDDINSFRMYGQAGIGVDVAFFFLETGLNYGFSDVFNELNSNPTQVFVNLGFRF